MIQTDYKPMTFIVTQETIGTDNYDVYTHTFTEAEKEKYIGFSIIRQIGGEFITLATDTDEFKIQDQVDPSFVYPLNDNLISYTLKANLAWGTSFAPTILFVYAV